MQSSRTFRFPAGIVGLDNQGETQARAIVKLKSTIKGCDARKEVRIEQLENEINELAGSRFDVDALSKLRDENEQLRESVQQLRSE